MSAAAASQIAGERRYLLRFANPRVRDEQLAEDLVQETLLAALQGAEQFEARASLRTWLTGILLRRISEHFRQRQRRPSLSDSFQEDSDESDDDADIDDSAQSIDPSRWLEGRQLLDIVSRELAASSPLAAQLIELREFDGLSHVEAAERLGLSAQNASSLLHRARTHLRHRWPGASAATAMPMPI